MPGQHLRGEARPGYAGLARLHRADVTIAPVAPFRRYRFVRPVGRPWGVYLGDSSALSGLPLEGTYTMADTPGARQVVITAPSTMQPGQAATVQVQLTASGDQTLPDVQLALQLPQGWTAVPTGPTEFTSVAPGTAPATTFQVTPPSYAPNASAVVHATATIGNMTREAGVTVTVS